MGSLPLVLEQNAFRLRWQMQALRPGSTKRSGRCTPGCGLGFPSSATATTFVDGCQSFDPRLQD
jgi:hypothetical protein